MKENAVSNLYTHLSKKFFAWSEPYRCAYFHVMTVSADCVHMKLVRASDVLACDAETMTAMRFCVLFVVRCICTPKWGVIEDVSSFMFAVRCSYALLYSIQIEINMMPISDGLTFVHIFETKFDNSRFSLHYGREHIASVGISDHTLRIPDILLLTFYTFAAIA